MAKFSGMIGYVKSVETEPGVYEDMIEEHRHYGDILQNTRRWEEGERINDALTINNRISVVADKFMRDNMYAMRYLWLYGQRWTITKVDIAVPRMVLTLGGIYNGPTPT